MPVTQSAKKAHRQSLTKRSRNKHFVALYKESLKKFEKALASGSKDVGTALSEVQSFVDTLVKKNVLHKNTAARKKSALAKMVAMAGGSTAVVKAPKAAAKTPAKKAPAKKEAPAKAEKAPAVEKAPKAPAKAKAPAAKKAPAKKTK